MKTPALLVALMLAALSIAPSSTPAAAQRQVVIETITCQSIGNQRNECRVRGRIQDVQPVAAFTNAPCVFGTSWGFDRRNVWVDQGCHAEFNVEVSRRIKDAEPEPQQPAVVQPSQSAQPQTVTETVDCRSLNFRRQECKVKGKIQNVEKVGTFSAFRCNLGKSWGSEDRLVWVDRGCAARFDVTYTRRTKPNVATSGPCANARSHSTGLFGRAIDEHAAGCDRARRMHRSLYGFTKFRIRARNGVCGPARVLHLGTKLRGGMRKPGVDDH